MNGFATIYEIYKNRGVVMVRKIKMDPREQDFQLLCRWHAGSVGGSARVDREAAFATVGTELIINVDGSFYTKYYLPGRKQYVVLSWDNRGNEFIE